MVRIQSYNPFHNIVYYVDSIQSDTDQYSRALGLWFWWTYGLENVLHHVEKRKHNKNINNKIITVFRNIFICNYNIVIVNFRWRGWTIKKICSFEIILLVPPTYILPTYIIAIFFSIHFFVLIWIFIINSYHLVAIWTNDCCTEPGQAIIAFLARWQFCTLLILKNLLILRFSTYSICCASNLARPSARLCYYSIIYFHSYDIIAKYTISVN